jgi:hypothetical protein
VVGLFQTSRQVEGRVEQPADQGEAMGAGEVVGRR